MIDMAIYQLATALRGQDTQRFCDIYLRYLVYIGQSFPTSILNDQEALQRFGYAVISGLLGTDKSESESSNKETENKEEGE
jgi:hypothetical protein